MARKEPPQTSVPVSELHTGRPQPAWPMGRKTESPFAARVGKCKTAFEIALFLQRDRLCGDKDFQRRAHNRFNDVAGSTVSHRLFLGFIGTGSSPSCPYLRGLTDGNGRPTFRE